jgi:hypothetical protein
VDVAVICKQTLATRHLQEVNMDKARTLNRNLETLTWGAVFIWWGITELLKFLPNGIDAVGFGLIFLGLNVARWLNGIPTNDFSITLGILALVWGGLDLAPSLLHLPFKLPVFAILLIVLGVIVVRPVFWRARKTGLGDLR